MKKNLNSKDYILYVDLKGYFLIKTLIEVNKASSIFESKAFLQHIVRKEKKAINSGRVSWFPV